MSVSVSVSVSVGEARGGSVVLQQTPSASSGLRECGSSAAAVGTSLEVVELQEGLVQHLVHVQVLLLGLGQFLCRNTHV